MRKTTKIIIITIIIATILLGIGYAAVQNITLNISGTAAADPSQSNFKVMFSGEPTVSDANLLLASITNDTNATINVTGLSAKGEVATAEYTVQNASSDLSADLSVSTTNSNTEYFTLSSYIDKTSLIAGETTKLTIKVELTKTPLAGSVNSTIGIQLLATPVQPGEEGTSGSTNDYSETPSLEKNEFGFYFEQPYSYWDTSNNLLYSLVFHEDKSYDGYENCRLVYSDTSSSLIYEKNTIINLNQPDSNLIISSDGKSLQISSEGNFVDSPILTLDTTNFKKIPNDVIFTNTQSGAPYYKYNYFPLTLENQDQYIYEDYLYYFESTAGGWLVILNDSYIKTLFEEEYGISNPNIVTRTQTTYKPIQKELLGSPIVGLYDTFNECTEMTVVPELPDTLIYMDSAFSGCTSLSTAPQIPASVEILYNTFSDCNSLTEPPEIPDGVTNMEATFCRSAISKAPVIPSSVTNLTATFADCYNLSGEIEINSSNLETYSSCFKNVSKNSIQITGSISEDLKNKLYETAK